MTLHALISFAEYRWNALSRHGVHSPFVYQFIERILRGRDPEKGRIPDQKPDARIPQELPSRYRLVLQRMIITYHYGLIQVLKNDAEQEPDACDMLIFTAEPKVWIRLFNRHWPVINADGCIVITGVHQTKRHTAKWNRICSHPNVKCAIDLYGIGVLFQKEEFKEKQCFVLQY